MSWLGRCMSVCMCVNECAWVYKCVLGTGPRASPIKSPFYHWASPAALATNISVFASLLKDPGRFFRWGSVVTSDIWWAFNLYLLNRAWSLRSCIVPTSTFLPQFSCCSSLEDTHSELKHQQEGPPADTWAIPWSGTLWLQSALVPSSSPPWQIPEMGPTSYSKTYIGFLLPYTTPTGNSGSVCFQPVGLQSPRGRQTFFKARFCLHA